MTLLSAVEASSNAAVEQHSDDASPIDCNVGVRCKPSVLPYTRNQPGKRNGSSFDPSVEFSVYGVLV